jgi:hypothetical protein
MTDWPAWAQGVLARAAELDSLLDAFAAPARSPGLASRIVGGAPRPRVRRWIGWLMPVGLGAGLAAACAAGIVAGAQFHASPSTPGASDADALITAVSDDDFGLYLDEEA